MVVSVRTDVIAGMDAGRSTRGSGRVRILGKFGESGRNMLNAVCEFFTFCGVSDRNCNEKVLH